MKKIILLFILLLSCSCKKEIVTEPVEEDNIVEKNQYIDDNPIVLGAYKKNGNVYELHNEFTSIFVQKKDIINFQIFSSNEDIIEFKGNYKDTWMPLWTKFDPDLKYKIGYIIEYTLKDDTIIKQQILTPDDTDDYYDYVEIYLYDAVYHSSDSFYSHITMNDFYDDTYFTSIKVTSGSKINEVCNQIKVTAFSYDEDDFGEDGYYRGKSYYVVLLNNSI